jgi:predicted O-linked N-acetylglucosamine transferase (SPINDLY family)
MSAGPIDQALTLALQHHKAGRLHEAEQLYRQILGRQPEHFDAIQLLGAIAVQVGRHADAVAFLRRGIALRPDVAETYGNLGAALKAQGQIDEAIIAYRQAIAINPNLPRTHHDLGIALASKGLMDDAVSAIEQAIALQPNYAQAHYDLGNVLKDQGRLDKAIAAYRQAIAVSPTYAPAHNNLANVLHEAGRLDEAIASHLHAITLRPQHAQAFSNLGVTYASKGLLDEAIAAHRQSIALKPDNADAHNNLGNSLKDKGLLDEAIAAYRHAMTLAPHNATFGSNLIFALLAHPASEANAIADEHDRWNRHHARPLKQFLRPHPNNRDPDRTLRIGYVSPDFRDHPVGRFLLPLLSAHNPHLVQIYCYANLKVHDSITAELKSHAHAWRDIAGQSDDHAARMIRDDKIDILVDLAMHTSGNRLLVFARKPAPVQVTYLAYAGGTALDSIDYRLTDRYLDPDPLDDRYYRETSLQLAGTYWCYHPSLDTEPVTNLPALLAGKITFGCLNNFAKASPSALDTWAHLLNMVPQSRLILATHSENQPNSLFQFMADRGIAPDRLTTTGRVSRQEYFNLYHRIDIALDPFPCAGATTTCDALWMGVPVVTLAGSTPIRRAGVSILSNAGLTELIANSPAHYIRIAADLAGNLPRLVDLRSTLRQRIQQSPLMDASTFARDVEAAFRHMWRNWCETSSPTAST